MEKQAIEDLPESPGVYIFKTKDKPIYIGKALNLKRRVNSYFDLNLQTKTTSMVRGAKGLEFIVVNSELEALILETKLIRKYQPKYNSVSKDDKHPLYITITKDKFPRVITSRRDGDFGPFPSSDNVKQVLKIIRRVFPFSDHKIGKIPCFYSHLGLCNPCPNLGINRNVYLKNIKAVKDILSGKFKSVQQNLEKEMNMLSKKQKFEEASVLRDQLQKLEYITQPIIPSDHYLKNPNLVEDLRSKEVDELSKIIKIKNLHRIECYDVSHLAGVMATASMVVFINGEPEKSEYRHFKIRQKNPRSDYDSIKEVSQRRRSQSWDNPDLIIIDGGIAQISAFETRFPKVGIAKNPDRLIIGNKVIGLGRNALNLVQRLRNEAHRFARRYHHKLISKNLIEWNVCE